MNVSDVQNLITALLFGQAWFIPFLVIAAICIVLVKIEKFSIVIVIPCLLVLEGMYYQNNTDAGSLIWAMIASLLLMLFTAAMAILERDHKN